MSPPELENYDYITYLRRAFKLPNYRAYLIIRVVIIELNSTRTNGNMTDFLFRHTCKKKGVSVRDLVSI